MVLVSCEGFHGPCLPVLTVGFLVPLEQVSDKCSKHDPVRRVACQA